MININSKIFIAGHKGMLGSSILRKFKKKGYKKLITIDKKTRSVLLSIKAKEEHDEKEALDSYQSDSSSKISGSTTLGELLKEKMVKK